MRRFRLFEFTDLPWYPQAFRRIQTDYLQFVATRGSGQAGLVPLLVKAMQHAETTEIVDLCSGGAGPWRPLQRQLADAGWPVSVKLTDKYPHPAALRHWEATSQPGVEYVPEPVDALNVPPSLKGMRTLFEGFHHFAPTDARSILQDAFEKRVAIGVFDVRVPRPWAPFLLALAPLSTLFGYLLLTPFITPRSWSRLLWTYLIPVVPLATCWDGVVSLLRVYSPRDLEAMSGQLRAPDYAWEIGTVSTGTPIFEYVYLVGYPVRSS
ncbi:MAG: hypothetical protein ABSE70_03040 [Candidatus Limnocylindrales bacterium]